MTQLITKEKFTSIQKAQAGLTRLLQEAEEDASFYRVLRNNQPVGVLLPNRSWESLLEDIEALSSENYVRKIAQSRRQKKKIALTSVKKELKI